MIKQFVYLLRRLHGIIYEVKKERKEIFLIKQKIQHFCEGDIFYVLTPTHGNLGDHAIALAVKNELKKLHLNYIEITTDELRLLKKYRKLKYLDGYPILVNGGGNIGTLWPSVEELFRETIKACPKSTILCLPNTAFFEKSSLGKKEYQKSKKIYSTHTRLKICAREKQSYELLKKIHTNVTLIPDMALLLNKCINIQEQMRKGCLVCLRSDREKTRTDEIEALIFEQLKQIFDTDIWESDMNLLKPVPVEYREIELENKFKEFRTAELVITDRLHGMVFAAVTGTPCIVLNSKSPKIKGCYEWIKELGYIKFLDEPSQFMQVYKLVSKRNGLYTNCHLEKYYKKLDGYLMDLAKGTMN